MKQWDFPNAYLNGVLPTDPPVYMHQPCGFTERGKEHLVCLMLKALYGMVQAGHIWYQTLLALYVSLGYKVSRADPAVQSHTFNIQSVHTDDVLTGASDEAEADQAMKKFSDIDKTPNRSRLNLLNFTIVALKQGKTP